MGVSSQFGGEALQLGYSYNKQGLEAEVLKLEAASADIHLSIAIARLIVSILVHVLYAVHNLLTRLETRVRIPTSGLCIMGPRARAQALLEKCHPLPYSKINPRVPSQSQFTHKIKFPQFSSPKYQVPCAQGLRCAMRRMPYTVLYTVHYFSLYQSARKKFFIYWCRGSLRIPILRRFTQAIIVQASFALMRHGRGRENGERGRAK